MRNTLEPSLLYQIPVNETWNGTYLFTPYDVVITSKPNVEVRVGRFSHNMVQRINVTSSSVFETRLSIGAFCESAMNSSIQVGGEHNNESLLNFCFGTYCEHYHNFMSVENLKRLSPRSRPIIIGDNVILSRDTLIANSANIGSACVIGAGALVVGKCESYGIYGGVPARLLKPRFDARMRDLYEGVDLPNIAAHSLVRLPEKMEALQNGSMSLAEFRASTDYLLRRPKLHLSATLSPKGQLLVQEIHGYSVGDEFVTDPSTLEKLHAYFDQAKAKQKPKSITWSPDIFYKLRLY